MEKKKEDRKVFFPEAFRRMGAQSLVGKIRSLLMLIRAILAQMSFMFSTFLPAIPATIRGIQSCDERNDTYHLYGKYRPGVLAIYAHGGCWGSTSARDYAGLAARMARAFDGPVFVVDQRIWPDADMLEQANDVAEVVRVAQERYPGRKSVLVGHSSGAHSVAIVLANGSTTVDAAVLQAGVYDPLAHYGHEGARGLETISTMAAAGDADEDILRLGDFAIEKLFFRKEAQVNSELGRRDSLSQLPLEGDREACHIVLPDADRTTPISWGATSGTFMMSAAEDDCSPLSGSLRFMKSLRTNGVSAKFLLYTCIHHVDFGFDWIRDCTVNEGVLDIDGTDKERRRTAFTVSYGKVATQLKEEVMSKEAPVAEHARDMCRIIRAVAGT